MNKIGKNIVKHSFRDEALMKMTPHTDDALIEVEVCDSTLGDVARWMAACSEEDMEQINKDNYRTFNQVGYGPSTAYRRWENQVIVAGGDLCYYLAGPNDTHKAKVALNKEYPLETPWLDIIGEYIDENWDNEVRVVSYYTGCQGLMTITVFDVNKKCALFSLGSSLELFGHFMENAIKILI